MPRLSQEEMRAFADAHVQDSCWPVPLNAPLQPDRVFRYEKGGRFLPIAKSEFRMDYHKRKHSRQRAESQFAERLYNPSRNWPCG